MSSPIPGPTNGSNTPSTSQGRAKVCAKCQQTAEKMSVCSQCTFTRYCGPDCQREDWKEHKKVCKALGQEKFAGKVSKVQAAVETKLPALNKKTDDLMSREFLMGIASNPAATAHDLPLLELVRGQKAELELLIKTKSDGEKILKKMADQPEHYDAGLEAELLKNIETLTNQISFLSRSYEMNKQTVATVLKMQSTRKN